MQRRTVLRACGVVGIAGLAGCGSGPVETAADDGTDTAADEGTEQPTASTPTDTAADDGAAQTTAAPTLTATTIATGEQSCGQGTDEASVSFGDGAVVVTGTISAADPCHTPVVSEVGYDETADSLSLTVDVESEAGTCTGCIGAVEYTVTATFEDGLPGRAVVDHTGVDTAVADVIREN